MEHALLQALRGPYREIVDSLDELILVHDLEGRVLLVNQPLQEILGHPEAELCERNVVDFVSEVDRAPVQDRRKRRRQSAVFKAFSYTVSVRRKGGENLSIEIDSVPLLADGAPAAILLVGRDSRHRVQLERAEAGNEAKSRFLVRMSHEVRAPINIFFGMTEMALEEDLPAPAHDALMRARRARRPRRRGRGTRPRARGRPGRTGPRERVSGWPSRASSWA